jgi:osmotically-inducible protein OsmY
MRTTYLLPMLLVASALSGCAAPVLMGAAAAGAVVVNQDERDAKTIATDEKIELNSAEIARRDAQLAQAHLNFTSVNGVVLITGEAPASEPLDKLKAEIAKLDKVREVRNEVVVGPVSSMGSRSQDSWITTKVKSRMVAEKNFRTNRIKVITEQQTVYLLGVVTKREGFVAGVIARDIEGVKRVVKMFEYTDQAS